MRWRVAAEPRVREDGGELLGSLNRRLGGSHTDRFADITCLSVAGGRHSLLLSKRDEKVGEMIGSRLRAEETPINLFLAENIYNLAVGWYIHVKREQLKHMSSADKNENWNCRIGYPAVVLQAIIGVSVFATYTNSEDIFLKTLAIMFTLISEGLVSLHNFNSYAREAEKHRLAASRLKSIIQDFEY